MTKLPVSFSQFVKNPIAAVSFLSLIGMVYLYMDVRNAGIATIEACTEREKIQNERITKLEGDLEKLHAKFIDVITEIDK